ncbi:DUF397 domain-containing protein [Streptomyces jeddahensis]|uniref:DUF397 domain-containing protein n=1 Tax=Streptomyces jeddahensis TaxID=1716141 RepID=A0A177HQL1_9ACTN|nr:DUF397 domain-containing protein [Streptomyces jeddahensis]OAH13183.1 hypothetical protein STSP_35080 [Streptomyces jeddahensis]
MESSSKQQLSISDASVLSTWRKSSYSGGSSGDCLEVNDTARPACVPVRDSKNPHGPAVVFSSPAWTSFVTAVKNSGLGDI